MLRRILLHLVRKLPESAGSDPGEAATVVKSDPEDIARTYAASLLAEARDELTRADSKASILLAAAGVTIGAIVGGMVSSGWTPGLLRTPWSVTWVLGAFVALLGVGALVVAVYPRTSRGRDDEGELFYFRQAAKLRTPLDLARELRRSSERTFERSADQLWRVSQVATTKYTLIRWAIWLLAVGSLTSLVSSIANDVTK